MNIIAWLEFEFSYFEATVQLFGHYATGTPRYIFCAIISWAFFFLLLLSHLSKFSKQQDCPYHFLSEKFLARNLHIYSKKYLRPLTSYLKNHPSKKMKTRGTLLEKQGRTHLTFLFGPFHMNVLMLTDQQEVIYICPVQTQDVIWKIYWERWRIGRDRDRERQGYLDRFGLVLWHIKHCSFLLWDRNLPASWTLTVL